MSNFEHVEIAIIGLGYVGLPLAVEFGQSFNTKGFDLNNTRINELQSGRDSTLEVEQDLLTQAKHLSYTSSLDDIASCNVYIVTVPTPIDEHNRPDLSPLEKASRDIGSVLSKGDTVIYESTVYPGATEEVCVPILENLSGLTFNKDFFVGYSPERTNPGDKAHRVSNILKVTSGSTPQTAQFVDDLYKQVIRAGTHMTSSIRVAEAAKVIENTQRDLNIALINELAIIFKKLNIDTLEVLEAAGTKWNFLPFRPGLVGGHCIGVDPYYLTYKAEEIGYIPDIILAGRRINDGMGEYVSAQVIKLMIQKRLQVVDANILILGLTFKENCPDIRNTRVVDIVKEFKNYGANIDIYDPWVDRNEAMHEYDIAPIDFPEKGKYDAIIIAVGHDEFHKMGAAGIKAFAKKDAVLFDIKSILPKADVDGRL